MTTLVFAKRRKPQFYGSWRDVARLMFISAALGLAAHRTPRVAAAEPPSPVDADVLLKGGQIIDGTGSPAATGDLAIRGDRIVAVGQIAPGQIGKTIDCTGLVIA